MKKNLFLAFLLLTALYACGVKSAQKTSEAKSSGEVVNSAEYTAGQTIYKEKCGKCHPAFPVKEKTVDRWNQVLQPMIKDKAKLNEADGKLVEAYVWAELGVAGK
ncbi:MAG: hypothetical protein GC192_09805 [Bacteroidetes bacterium]|nr:hypothetical protein [Bacteroidota bacterium]